MNIVNNLQESPELQHHAEWLRIYTPYLNQNSRVQAAAILGSIAKGTSDRISDLDLVIFVEKNDLGFVADQIFGVHSFEVIHEWKMKYTKDHVFCKRVYDNFLSVEIHIVTTESSLMLRKPYITIFDSNNLIALKTESGTPPTHDTFDALPAGIDGLGWELFDMFKWWTRGNKALVLTHLKKISSRLN